MATGNAYSDDGELKLEVNGHRVSGWQTIRVTRGLERCPSDYDISVTEKFPGSSSDLPILAGDVCRVRIGGDLVLTGYVDRVIGSIAADDHTIRIMGRSACADVVDSSIDYRLGVINKQTMLGIVTILCEPRGVKVVALAGVGPLIPQLTINLGETAYQVIERLARYGGMLAYDDVAGNLVLAQVGTEKMASGIQQGRNVLAATVEYALDQRFSRYHAFRLSVDSFTQYEPTSDPNEVATVEDEAVGQLKRPDGQPRVRDLAIISEQMDSQGALVVRRANYEKRHRYGRSQAVRVTVDSWRDSAGKLWEPNYRLPVTLPALKVTEAEMVIGEVIYLRDEAGTRAELTLMPPEAYEPEPTILTMYDWQVKQAVDEGAHDDRRDRDSYAAPIRDGRRDHG